MPAPTTLAPRPAHGWRFGVPGAAGMEWMLRRNCSIAPVHLLAAFAGLCGLALGVASVAWVLGARWAMPFAGCELLAVGLAMLVFARHAGDAERITLGAGGLVVEHRVGGRVDRWQAAPQWVRVGYDGRSPVVLACGGEEREVGRYMRPEWRPVLAEELRSALRGWRMPAQAQ